MNSDVPAVRLVAGEAHDLLSYRSSMKSRLFQTIALICAIVCASAGPLPLALLTDLLYSQSHGSGAPAVWCRYDAHGTLVERELDTNGDGRPDVAEYYGHGALLRRDSDRNFNGVTDLVEDFDADTQERVRSIVDQDYDGTADLLVLFRNGEPVVSERAPAAQTRVQAAEEVDRRSSTGLVSLKNPFGVNPAFESAAGAVPYETWIGTAAKALPVSFPRFAAPVAALASSHRSSGANLKADLFVRSPRGPPQA